MDTLNSNSWRNCIVHIFVSSFFIFVQVKVTAVSRNSNDPVKIIAHIFFIVH